jgi:hypothetical protein
VLEPPTPQQVKAVRGKHEVIKSFLFFKEKTGKSGNLEKLKARLVAINNGEDVVLCPNQDALTVRSETVLMELAIAGAEGRRCAAIDIGNAFLEADVRDEDIYVEMDPAVVQAAKEIDRSPETYETTRGTIVAKLRKALGGCVRSARLWYNRIREVLDGIGFKINPHDQCSFNMMRDGKQITICIYVNDLLLTSACEANLGLVRVQLARVLTTMRTA